MIRKARLEDKRRVVEIGSEVGVFGGDSAALDTLMDEYFAVRSAHGDVCLVDDAQGPVGVAYYTPVLGTHGTWYLTLIAVEPEHQRDGRGSSLWRFVESELRRTRQRLLLVQVPAEQVPLRMFCLKCGYREAGQLHGFYAEGRDMVVFGKDLGADLRGLG